MGSRLTAEEDLYTDSHLLLSYVLVRVRSISSRQLLIQYLRCASKGHNEGDPSHDYVPVINATY